MGQSLTLYPEEPALEHVNENKFQTVVKSKQEQLHDEGSREKDEAKSSPPIQEKKSAAKIGDMANKSPTMNDIPDQLEARQSKSKDMLKRVEIFKHLGEKKTQKQAEKKSDEENFNRAGSLMSIVKSFDDTIYGVQPSNVYDSQLVRNAYQTKNSNFKSVSRLQKQKAEAPATRVQENEILEKIKAVMLDPASNQVSTDQNNRTGLQLNSVDSAQMKLILTVMHLAHQGNDDIVSKVKTLFPADIEKLLKIYDLAMQFQMEVLREITLLKIIKHKHYIQYTNVRRWVVKYLHYLNNGVDTQLQRKVIENASADLMVFLLTDPDLIDYFGQVEEYRDILASHYVEFTKNRLI